MRTSGSALFGHHGAIRDTADQARISGHPREPCGGLPHHHPFGPVANVWHAYFDEFHDRSSYIECGTAHGRGQRSNASQRNRIDGCGRGRKGERGQ
jgi:hypothetical protein